MRIPREFRISWNAWYFPKGGAFVTEYPHSGGAIIGIQQNSQWTCARARLCLAKGGARFPRSENQNRRLRRAGGGGPFYTIWWNVSNPGMMFPYAGRVFLGIPGIHAEMWSPPPWRRGFLGGPGGRHAEMWNRGFGVDWLDSGGFGNAGGNRAPGQFRRWAPFAFKCCVGWTHKTLSPPSPVN